MAGHARDDEAGLEQEAPLQELAGLAVQEVLPPAIRHVLGQNHGHVVDPLRLAQLGEPARWFGVTERALIGVWLPWVAWKQASVWPW